MLKKKEILFSKDEIDDAVLNIAQKVSEEFSGGELLIVGVLKGAFIFMADLIRKIHDVDIVVDFVVLRSYGSSTASSGEVQVVKDLHWPVEGKDVLVVEDIVDTGLTLKFFKDQLLRRGPKSVRICALLDKRERREVEIDIDYLGLLMDDGFVVGYGLDCDENYRNLPEIWLLEEE